MSKNKIIFLLLCFFACLFSSGCASFVSRNVTSDLKNLKDELFFLQIQCSELKQNYAELCMKVCSNCEVLDTLSTLANNNLNNGISTPVSASLTQMNQDDNSSSDDAIVSSYQRAYSDYCMGKFDIACSGFETFIEKHPNSDLVPQAQFYIGECFYSDNMWDKALEEYKKIEQNYKISRLIPSARLKIALCLEFLNRRNEALNIFSSIVKDFPQSHESSMSKERLKTYSNAQKR
ncbi:MAG: tetratricopeptide repeat protein [Endomicrobium sp.]|jgi:tol-pal system protein YbgF|nr:tetratricopeptide repeat protein [Endomicrobium sp.]